MLYRFPLDGIIHLQGACGSCRAALLPGSVTGWRLCIFICVNVYYYSNNIFACVISLLLVNHREHIPHYKFVKTKIQLQH